MTSNSKNSVLSGNGEGGDITTKILMLVLSDGSFSEDFKIFYHHFSQIELVKVLEYSRVLVLS